jgi:NAD(P)-dependent dehydrogenase (short-subunit alcohol dehydrogenase family)
MSRVWLVTGCARGLGRRIAEAVLAAGHRLVATARDPRELAFLPPGDRLRTAALDVTDAAAARAAVAVATSAFGRLDVVVNNAGYIKANSIEDQAEDEFRRQLEIDFFGVYHVTRAALPVMHAQRDGHIIQISSIGGRRTTPGLGAYQAAKWAVGGFSEVLAREVAPLGIRVTCVEPGGMRTDMFGLSMLDQPIASDYQPTVEAVLRGTFGNPDRARNDPAKVAQVILRLAVEKQPPVRLLLGSDAVFLAVAAARERAEEDARWKALSMSTDYDGLGDFADSDAAKALARPRSTP